MQRDATESNSKATELIRLAENAKTNARRHNSRVKNNRMVKRAEKDTDNNSLVQKNKENEKKERLRRLQQLKSLQDRMARYKTKAKPTGGEDVVLPDSSRDSRDSPSPSFGIKTKHESDSDASSSESGNDDSDCSSLYSSESEYDSDSSGDDDDSDCPSLSGYSIEHSDSDTDDSVNDGKFDTKPYRKETKPSIKIDDFYKTYGLQKQEDASQNGSASNDDFLWRRINKEETLYSPVPVVITGSKENLLRGRRSGRHSSLIRKSNLPFDNDDNNNKDDNEEYPLFDSDSSYSSVLTDEGIDSEDETLGSYNAIVDPCFTNSSSLSCFPNSSCTNKNSAKSSLSNAPRKRRFRKVLKNGLIFETFF